MKTEDLKAQGLTAEQITFVMAENGKDIKREQDKAESYKTQLDTAKETLKTFDGIDVKDLQSKVATLTADLAAKDKEYADKIADRDFNDLVGRYAKDFKARDVKAVMPFLDVETLKSSKNQESDIKNAFETIKKENAYLFEDDKAPRVVGITKGPDDSTDDTKTKANDALRSLYSGKD